MLKKKDLDRLKEKVAYSTYFENLMQERIRNVLLVCSKYDAFVLEEDGRVEEHIFKEYVSLNLRNTPSFIQAFSLKKAIEILSEQDIDLIIIMLKGKDIFRYARLIKKEYPDIPIVLLTYFSREVSIKLDEEKPEYVDYVFSWLGNADILLAVIKLIEDTMNTKHDVLDEGVQVILLIENSIRYYSSYLPNIYKIIFKQSTRFMAEGLNEYQKMLRMRGRPKILLALDYEEAISLYGKYKDNILGIISDISYNKNNRMDDLAGIKLLQKVKKDNKNIPFILQSSKDENREYADQYNVGFIHKYSTTLSMELKDYINRYFAFGDFVFRDPETLKEISRASDLKTLHKSLKTIPDESLVYHIKRDDFSKWFFARALFPLGRLFKKITYENFYNLDDVRIFLYDSISFFRARRSKGVIAKFDKKRYDDFFLFSRIGDGLIGGKARGLAFIDLLIKENRLFDKYKNINISIPKTTVLSTEVFDEFMSNNNLYEIGLSDLEDSEILSYFIKAWFPNRYREDLETFISYVNNPIAVRSSSMLEDSQYQPFAGIYKTYMIPNVINNKRLTLEMLINAIKSVYASVYYKSSKSYMTATSNSVAEEKMGIVLQEVCGKKYDNRFYPTISGVARSLNYYPIPPERAFDGIVNIAFGLGRIIVSEGISLHYSPKHPKRAMQLSSPEMALKSTQKFFYSLNLDPKSFTPSVNENINFIKQKIKDAEKDKSLKHIASSFDFQNNVLRDGINYPGKKIITFSHILNHNVFPLSKIISDFLRISSKEMNDHVEIEFAVDINNDDKKPVIFNFLQIRPIVEDTDVYNFKLENVSHEKTIIYSNSALGNGKISGIYDFVYVIPESFKSEQNKNIVSIIEKINKQLAEESRNYILVGPGRWGSTDPWLGIPVDWSQISAARVIVESGLPEYRIDPSQGTHFFHNLTAFKVGYFTINPFMDDGYYDTKYLDDLPAYYEDGLVRHIRFNKPLTVLIDGRKNIGVIFKEEG